MLNTSLSNDFRFVLTLIGDINDSLALVTASVIPNISLSSNFWFGLTVFAEASVGLLSLIPCWAHTSRLVFSNCFAYASAPGRPNWSVVNLAGPLGFVCSALSFLGLSSFSLAFSLAFLLSDLASVSFSIAAVELLDAAIFSRSAALLVAARSKASLCFCRSCFLEVASSLLIPPINLGSIDRILSIISPIIKPNRLIASPISSNTCPNDHPVL